MKRKNLPGIAFEKAVARVQQAMDPNSTVTHNEILRDRLGNERQFDVVIRGVLGGYPMLGVIECKDFGIKVGPALVEAFAKKCEHVQANLKVMASKKGFTDQAMVIAKHEGIECISPLPVNAKPTQMAMYAEIWSWEKFDMQIFPAGYYAKPEFSTQDVFYNGKLVIEWFLKELVTTHGNYHEVGTFRRAIYFKNPVFVEIHRRHYEIRGISFNACRICTHKKKILNMYGDAFYNLQRESMMIPNNGEIVTEEFLASLVGWDISDGVVPEPSGEFAISSFRLSVQPIDVNKEVVDLSEL